MNNPADAVNTPIDDKSEWVVVFQNSQIEDRFYAVCNRAVNLISEDMQDVTIAPGMSLVKRYSKSEAEGTAFTLSGLSDGRGHYFKAKAMSIDLYRVIQLNYELGSLNNLCAVVDTLFR